MGDARCRRGAAEVLGPDFARRLLDRTLTEVMRDVGAHGGGISLIMADNVLGMEVGTGVPPRFAAPLARLNLTTPDPATDAVRERRLVWVGTEGELARRYPRAALAMPYHFALAAAPITTGATPWGALLLLWPGSHPPKLSLTERDRIRATCDHMAGLLCRADEAGQPVRPRPQPREIPQPRTSSAGPTEALSAVDFVGRLPEGGCGLDLDGRITFISHKAAHLVGEGIQRLLGAPLWEALPWLHDPVYEDCFRAAVVSRQPTSFTALRPPDQWLSFHLYPDASGVSVRITPADIGDHRRSGLPADVTFSAAPTRVGAIYHMMHLAGALTEAAGERDVVGLVADHILPAFGAQALALLVAESGRLRIVGYHGYRPEVIERFDRLPLTSQTPGVRALTVSVPAFFGSAREMAQAFPDRDAMDDGMAAWAYLPLIASGHPIGSCVLAYDQPHYFTPDERATLASLFGPIAQALDRARMYDSKLQLAHGLQAALLPHELPRISGLDVAARYLPASHGMDVGGDFYDLIRLDNSHAAAVIGDVQGHNVNAAALMGQVRTAVHANVTSGAAPAEVLARTNRLLTDLDPGLFTSCLYVHLDLRHHRACLASAGHPPPLLRHPDGRTDVLDLPPGLLLGIEPTTDYPTIEIALPPGAVLAFYTDGLVETPEADLGHSITALANHLAAAPEQPLSDLAETLISHARPSGDRTDDTALLLLRPAPDGWH